MFTLKSHNTGSAGGSFFDSTMFISAESQTVMQGTRCKNPGCKTVSAARPTRTCLRAPSQWLPWPACLLLQSLWTPPSSGQKGKIASSILEMNPFNFLLEHLHQLVSYKDPYLWAWCFAAVLYFIKQLQKNNNCLLNKLEKLIKKL